MNSQNPVGNTARNQKYNHIMDKVAQFKIKKEREIKFRKRQKLRKIDADQATEEILKQIL